MSLGSTAELVWMLKDAGVPVSFGSTSTYGLFDRKPVISLDADGPLELPTYQKVVRLAPADAAPLKTEDAITVNGVAMVVRHVGEVEDDGLVDVFVTEVK